MDTGYYLLQFKQINLVYSSYKRAVLLGFKNTPEGNWVHIMVLLLDNAKTTLEQELIFTQYEYNEIKHMLPTIVETHIYEEIPDDQTDSLL